MAEPGFGNTRRRYAARGDLYGPIAVAVGLLQLRDPVGRSLNDGNRDGIHRPS